MTGRVKGSPVELVNLSPDIDIRHSFTVGRRRRVTPTNTADRGKSRSASSARPGRSARGVTPTIDTHLFW